MTSTKPGYVVSLSGGKDSTAMLLMMLEKGEQVDDVVMFDMGWEFPEMYEHLDKLEQDTGLTITRLKPPTPLDYLMFDKPLAKGKRKGQKGYGWARPNARWCTSIKTNTLDKHMKQYADSILCVGIAADETKRPTVPGKRYPLREWGTTEKQCLDYCLSRGYTWGGLYSHFDRVSCWCCPLKSLPELRALRKYHPQLWQRLLEMDDRACNSYRIDYTVKQLEERFSQEDRQMKLELFGMI